MLRSGELRHPGGGTPDLQLTAALGTANGSVYYPVVDEILVLLPSLALVRVSETGPAASYDVPREMDAVRAFYDELGWRQSETGDFADAELFEDLRPVSAKYIHECHLRVNRYLPSAGRFILDVASGPIQYDEYLTYSEGFDYHVCGDISLTALRAAKRKLGDRGIYLQCDITRLPIRDESMDSFVSLHTIYHVPATRQIDAFRELERVLAAGRSGVVVYSWGAHSLAMLVLTPSVRKFASILLPRKAIAAVKRMLGTRAASKSEGTGEASEAQSGAEEQLYFSPHSYRWFTRTVAATPAWDVAVWRSVNVPFLRRYVRGERGRRFLERLYRWEEARPRLLGRLGQYPLLVYTKPRQ